MAWLNKPDDTCQTWHYRWPALLTSYSQFCPKFRCHGNGGRSRKNAIGSIRWPIPENPPIGAKISYASRVISNFVPNFVAMAMGVGWGKCNWQNSMGHPWKPPYRHKNVPKISYSSWVIANFVPNFVAMAVGEKRQLAAFDGPSPKNPYRHKNLLRKPSYSQFCPKFCCHDNGGWSGKNAIGSIRWPIPENPRIGAKISYASRVIANFVPNFVAMATREGPG